MRLVNGQTYPYHTQSLNYGGGLSTTPWERLNIVYSLGYGLSRSLTDGTSEGDAPLMRHSTQRIKVNLFVSRSTTLTAIAEGTYNNLSVRDRHVWLGDVVVRQKYRQYDIQLELNNLFDRRHYTQVYTSGLDTYMHSAPVRSRHLLLTVRGNLKHK
jgi:hypothetical protein